MSTNKVCNFFQTIFQLFV